ncbi:hypothetical protein CEXT_312011 [Caerostris extrusa]|uniref:Uncharacterized protein n=1 Tax=Caerostris extrusa TaxID=172846 RepID=A0AAV4RJ54_CAEEX|nr:hypothetical protein CEXT_312011 [Caerostris extrusa]
MPLVWSHLGSERQAAGLSAGVWCLRRAARVLSLGCYRDAEHLLSCAPRGRHLLPPSGSGSRSSEEPFGQNSVATESATESYVHLEHRTIRQDVFKGLEATDILASQYDECKYSHCSCIPAAVLATSLLERTDSPRCREVKNNGLAIT